MKTFGSFVADRIRVLLPSHANAGHSSFATPFAICIVALLWSGTILRYHVGHARFGNLYWSLQASDWFGQPEAEKAQRLTPFYRNCCGELGFDGQFYYYISNDPFITKDVKLHVDAPSYRYQRIFPPLLARVVSLALLSPRVTPQIYYATLLGLYGIGVFTLVFYLQQWNSPVWYALPWALFFGTQYSLFSGSVDAAGEALLIVAMTLALREAVWPYAVFMSAAVLTRETYALIAAGFLLCLTFYQPDSKKTNNSVIAYSLPLIAVSGWYAYVHWHLAPLPLEQMLGIINVPFRAFLLALRTELSGRLTVQVRYELLPLFIYGALLFVSGVATLRLSLVRRLFLALFAYVVLLACLGRTVMDFGTNFLRVSSVMLAMLALCLPHLQGRLRTTCAVTLIMSGLLGALLLGRYEDKIPIVPPLAYNSSVPSDPPKMPRQRFDCELQPISFALRPDATIPFASIFTPPYFTIMVHGRNLSEAPLQKDRDSQGKATYLYYRWFDLNGKPVRGPDSLRSSLFSDIAPNSEFLGKLLVIPPKRMGSYVLRLSLIDEGEAEFFENGNCKLDLSVDISGKSVNFPRKF